MVEYTCLCKSLKLRSKPWIGASNCLCPLGREDHAMIIRIRTCAVSQRLHVWYSYLEIFCLHFQLAVKSTNKWRRFEVRFIVIRVQEIYYFHTSNRMPVLHAVTRINMRSNRVLPVTNIGNFSTRIHLWRRYAVGPVTCITPNIFQNSFEGMCR